MTNSLRLRLTAAACAVAGAIAPDVLIVYSKRWAVPPVDLPNWQYFVATLMYIGIAAVLGAIFPYRPQPSAWKGFGVGVGTPVILGMLASAIKPVSLAPRGIELSATFWDLMSIW